jgi:hypothetical protein
VVAGRREAPDGLGRARGYSRELLERRTNSLLNENKNGAQELRTQMARRYLHNIHFVSCVPNTDEYHEFKSLNTHVRFGCKTSPIEMVCDKIKAPTGSGFGVDFDPEWVAKHQNVRLYSI